MSDSATVLEDAGSTGGERVGGRENNRDFLRRLPVGDSRAAAMIDSEDTNGFNCTSIGRTDVAESRKSGWLKSRNFLRPPG